MILEDQGDYHQTLREKYTGKKGAAFRRSFASGAASGRGGYPGPQSAGDSLDLSSDSESDENLSLQSRDEKSPTSSQRTSSSCEDSFPVSPVSESSTMAALASPFAPQMSQDNPMFNTRGTSSSAGRGGASQQANKQVLNSGSNLYRAGRSLSVGSQRSPGMLQPKTPKSSLKAAIQEEEELVLSEEKELQGAVWGPRVAGGRGRPESLQRPGAMEAVPGVGRKLFHESKEEESEEGSKILARPKEEARAQAKVGLGLGMGMVSRDGDILSMLAQNRLEALLMPAGKRLLKCKMIRKRGIVGSYPIFEMLLDNVPGVPEDRAFLLCARKRKKSKSSYYVISTRRDGLTRESEGYIAKLRGNIFGSEYTLIRRNGGAAERQDGDEQLLAIRYKQTLLSKDGGPRSMTAIFTDPAYAGHEAANTDLVRHYKDTKERLKNAPGALLGQDRREPELRYPPQVVLKSLEPQWREDLQSYVLDFKGRVTEASVKNFVMVDTTTSVRNLGDSMVDGVVSTVRPAAAKKPEAVIFGKRGKNEFSLDVAAPCSILQAFAMAIASTDFKMVNSM